MLVSPYRLRFMAVAPEMVSGSWFLVACSAMIQASGASTLCLRSSVSMSFQGSMSYGGSANTTLYEFPESLEIVLMASAW